MDWKAIEQSIVATAVSVGTKLLGAIVVYLIGRWAIGLIMRLVGRMLRGYKFDETVMSYLISIVNVLLNMILVLVLLGFFGIETTSFAALLAGAGLAIGTAWGGLLGHFAAGIFMVILRPFKVGDFISAGGVTGTVSEIGLFSTTILAPDNVINYVGNGKIFSDNIQNYTATPYRRVDLTAQLAQSVDAKDAIRRLGERIARIPNVNASPSPVIEIGTFTERGPVLVVRPCTPNQHYWQVFFDTNRAIKEVFTEAGYPIPEDYSAERSIG
jgi:small conductance mechanosensitive channel